MKRNELTSSQDSADLSSFRLPASLTIASPKRVSYPRGLASPKKADTPYNVRYNEDELASIRAAAALLEMPISEFLRWVGYFASQEVIKEHRQWTREKLQDNLKKRRSSIFS